MKWLQTFGLLVEKGADIESLLHETSIPTTLMWAETYDGHIDVVTFFFKAGANLKTAAGDPSSPVLKDVPGKTKIKAVISLEKGKWILRCPVLEFLINFCSRG